MALIENIKTYKKMIIEVDQPINDIVAAVQEDANSRYLDIQLFKDGVPFDLTNTKVRIYMVKPDGMYVFNDGEIKDPTSGRCQFLLTTQILAACGEAEVQIKVFSMEETQIVSTQVFKMYITKTLLTNEDIESSNEYGSLVILFQNVYEALQMIKAMLDNFGEPGETAAGISVDTFWKMLEAVYNVNADALKNASVSEVLERIGTSSDSSNTDTLFGKIQAVKESTAAKRYFFSETVQETKEGYDFISIKNANKAMSVILFSKVAEYDGTIGFSTTLNINAGNGRDYIAIAAFTPSTIIGSGSGNETNLEQVFFSPERTVYGPQAYGTIIPYIGPGVDSTYKGLVNFKYVGLTVGGPSIDTTVLVNCKKGEKIVVLGMAYGANVSDTFNIGQVKVRYDIK